MGSGQSVCPQTAPWKPQDWQEVIFQPLNFGKAATLKNLHTGAMVDVYQLSWHNKREYQFYLKSFNWRNRKQNLGPIVASVGIQEITKDGFCSNRWAANIFLEHIGIRLSQIQDVPLSDSLFILLEALQGFEHLYHHAGYFRVQEEQICVDRGGKVKVWVNGNLSKNFPQIDAETECLRRDETHMVRQLVDLIESNTDPDQRPVRLFSEFLKEIRRQEGCQIGFQRARSAVLDYSRVYNIVIPHRIEAALELYKHQQTKISINRKPDHEQRNENHTTFSNCHSSPNLQSTTIFSLPSNNQFYPPPQPQPFQTFQTFEPVPIPVTYTAVPSQSGQIFSNSPAAGQEEHKIAGSAVKTETNINCQHASRHTTNTRSIVANLEDTTENFTSNVIDETQQRSLGGSQRGPYSCQNQRGKDWIRYSQQIENNYTQYQFNSFKFNRDTFGLSPQKKLMKESTSSYRIPSSNSSRSPGRFSRRSYKSSKKGSGRGSSKKSEIISERWQMEKDRYFVSLGDECLLDPEIAADITKYLG